MRLSKGAEKILRILRRHNQIVLLEYEFIDLNGKNKTPLRYDFAVLHGAAEVKCLIEYDGEAHFQQIRFFHHTKSGFKKSQERDRKKNKYALLHNIPLYRIPYWEIDNINTLQDIFQSKFLVKNKYHNDYVKAP